MWENPALDATSRMYWKDYERFHDKMEKFRPHYAKDLSPKTVQEWQRLAMNAPRRFQKPVFSRYVKAGRA